MIPFYGVLPSRLRFATNTLSARLAGSDLFDVRQPKGTTCLADTIPDVLADNIRSEESRGLCVPPVHETASHRIHSPRTKCVQECFPT